MILYQTTNSMSFQINTLLTEHATACITHANKLAQENRQRTIHGEDIFRGIHTFFQNHNFDSIFRKMLNIPEELLDEYFQTRYGQNMPSQQRSKKLPLSKKCSTAMYAHSNKQNKKLDLDALFLASFDDLSNQFTEYLYEQGIDIKTIVKNYKRLSQTPIIRQMWLFAFLEILSKILKTFDLDSNKSKLWR